MSCSAATRVDELAQVLGQLVGRDPRELVDPPQRQVHQPRAEHELEDDDPHADRDRDPGREDAQLGERDQHQAEDAVEQEQHSRRPDEEVRQGQHPRGDVADAVVGALVARRRGRVERRVADRPGTIEPLPVLGLELERVAVGLHRLLELARVEPVALAFGAAVNLQIGPEERHFLQVHPASRTLPIGRDGSFRVQLEQLFELPRLAAEQEDLAPVQPDPLAGLAGIDHHAALGHRLDQRGRCTTRTVHRRGLPPANSTRRSPPRGRRAREPGRPHLSKAFVPSGRLFGPCAEISGHAFRPHNPRNPIFRQGIRWVLIAKSPHPGRILGSSRGAHP